MGWIIFCWPGASEPVSFFAYPGTPSKLAPVGCDLEVLAAGHEDVAGALQALMTELNAGSAAPVRYETAVFGRADGVSFRPERLQP